jgi:hypothetical protein
MNQRSPLGERQRPVRAGRSSQWVACKLWSQTIAQQRPASEMKPGETSPGTGIVAATGRTVSLDAARPRTPGVGRLLGAIGRF